MYLPCFRLDAALPDAYMSSRLSLLMGFLIDFLCLVLFFDFCNVDFIVDGPDGAGKRKARKRQRNKNRWSETEREKDT